jgi:Kef-type K+ transport system membrane component KefB
VVVVVLFVVIRIACVSKIMGIMIVATTWSMVHQKAFVLGFFMNTKGLVELIVLNIGLAKGVCKPFLFVNL